MVSIFSNHRKPRPLGPSSFNRYKRMKHIIGKFLLSCALGTCNAEGTQGNWISFEPMFDHKVTIFPSYPITLPEKNTNHVLPACLICTLSKWMSRVNLIFQSFFRCWGNLVTYRQLCWTKLTYGYGETLSPLLMCCVCFVFVFREVKNRENMPENEDKPLQPIRAPCTLYNNGGRRFR